MTQIQKALTSLNRLTLRLVFISITASPVFAQYSKPGKDSTLFFASVETDPAFWAGTLSNGFGFDANIDFRLTKYPHLRFGILGYSGKWSGDLGKSILLTNDFTENNWATQWNGLGIETQRQFRLGLERGGLQPGIRLQWNQFVYTQDNITKGKANHFTITPQVGFQWFPFQKIGLYVLPWAGVQIPVLGTDQISINGEERATRQLMPVVTAHIGWEFKF